MELARMTNFPKIPARMSDADRTFNARLERVQSKMLHAIELMTDKMVDRYTDVAPTPEETPEVRRRAMANIFANMAPLSGEDLPAHQSLPRRTGALPRRLLPRLAARLYRGLRGADAAAEEAVSARHTSRLC
jgi:hypothetical protein